MHGSVGSGRRTTTSSTLCDRFRSRSALVRRQHSPLSLLCITMILRVHRNFFEITTFPNSGIRAWFYALMLCTSRTQVSCGRYKSYCLPACHTLVQRYCEMKRPSVAPEPGFNDDESSAQVVFSIARRVLLQILCIHRIVSGF